MISIVLALCVAGCSAEEDIPADTSQDNAVVEECDRACLEKFADQYLDALVAHDPSQIPLADNVKFTENGQEVVDNILINSVKYNDKESIDIIIKIKQERKDDKNYIKVEFIDNGMGIKDDRKDIIFKRGYREFKGEKGMGLGLSLVKKIVNNYNGKIWVEDKVDGDYSQGSKFVVLIPQSN